MLLQLLFQHPQMIGTVLGRTPAWVWALLAGLAMLGYGQVRDREASLVRISVLPFVMTALSIWGMASAFGASPMFGYTMLVWLAATAIVFAAIAPMPVPAGTTYDASTRTYFLRGSWMPMAMILGIFVTKYIVGVDTAMNPGLARDGAYTLVVGAMYGVFSGLFLGRAARLWRLALRCPVSLSLRA